MRRLAFAAAVCGTLVLAACSDQTPTEPTVPPPSENFGSSCRVTPFPLLAIANQIKAIYPATPRAQALLRAEALLRAAAIKLLWDTCHPAAAKLVAFSFIDWLNHHTPAHKETQVQDLILAILRGIGVITGAPADGDFGVGLYNPANHTVITTLNHHALIELEPGSFLVPTEIVISRKAGDPDLTLPPGDERNQFPPTYDYNAINSTNTHDLQPGKTANIAFCLVIIGGPETPGNGYPDPANLRIGHNPFGGGFEILVPVDNFEASELRNSLTCPGIDDVTGSAGGGLQNFANAALRTAGSYLLPPPLWAAALGTLPPPPPRTGKAGSLSPFKPVEVNGDHVSFTEDPSTNNTSTGNYFKGVTLDNNGDGGYPEVEILTGSGTRTGAGTNVTVSLIQTAGSGGVLNGTLTQPVTSFESGGTIFPQTAQFNDLTISAPGTYKLMFTAPGAASKTSAEFKVYTMAFTVQPFATAGHTFTENEFLGQTVAGFDNPVVQVSIVDFANAVVTTANDQVEMAVTSGSLNGDTSVPANSGVANFTEINASPIFQSGLKVGVETNENNISLQASANYFGTNPVQATSTTFNVQNVPPGP
jgi:hypothetical protein